ncbi:hypothetical protein c7_R1145 [Megavirus courdo7]|uniref:Endonuclease/exonuclease/phosphatase domain-containing protein n=1 Tax=Megavirus courdo7 TaxID=1128135 RepID=H2EC69_9VIRU|nr:hypothetical protein c7_R1145 [Megavirus courdo7]
MNHNLRTDQQDDSPIQFMTWNIPAGLCDHDSWNNRVGRIVKLLSLLNPDIACLQKITGYELRNKFIHNLNDIGYDVAYAPRNANEICTNNLIAYNRRRVSLYKTKNIQLMSKEKYVPDDISNVNGFGTNLFLAYFSRCIEGQTILGSKFVVGNVHFPMNKQSRLDCSQKLAEWCAKNKIKKYIIGGALNSYTGNGYDEQIDILEKSTTRVEDKGMCNGTKISGTFLGSEKDKFKFYAPKLDTVDHILYNSDFMRHSNTRFDARTMLEPEPELFSTRDLPSDHLPKMVDITFNKFIV